MEGVFCFMLVCYKLFSNIEFKSHERPIQTKKLTNCEKKSLCLYHTRHIFYHFNPFIYLINGNVCKERKKRLPLPQKLPLHVHETQSEYHNNNNNSSTIS